MPTAVGRRAPPPLRDIALAAALLGLLFALLPLPWVQAGFRQVALGLAFLSEALLSGLGQGIERSGAVLRAIPQGHAVEVTAACDGHGLIVAWIALLALLRPSPWRFLLALALGIAAIQGFNLIRVMALFAASPAGSASFDALHYVIFPLLSAALLTLMGTGLARPAGGAAGLAAALVGAAVLTAIWLLGADGLAAAFLVSVADMLLQALGIPEVAGLVRTPEGWAVDTRLIAATAPLAYHRLPIHPADYALATPMLLAAGALGLARRPWSALGLGLVVVAAMVAALALGSLTTVWTTARDLGLGQIALPAGAGQVSSAPYVAPGVVAEVAALVQNVIVHALLLVLPARLMLRVAR